MAPQRATNNHGLQAQPSCSGSLFWGLRNARKVCHKSAQNNVILNAIVPKVRLGDNAGQKKFVLKRRAISILQGAGLMDSSAKQGSWASQFFTRPTLLSFPSAITTYLLIVLNVFEQEKNSLQCNAMHWLKNITSLFEKYYQ